jgi:hypothetical protein
MGGRQRGQHRWGGAGRRRAGLQGVLVERDGFELLAPQLRDCAHARPRVLHHPLAHGPSDGSVRAETAASIYTLSPRPL